MGIRSFDIFDTCLVRTCGAPQNIFTIMARSVIPDANNTQVAEFVRIRVNGEAKARKFSKNEDVTLDEIYSMCDFTGLTTLSCEQIMKCELATEEANLKPVVAMQKTINNLRSQGYKIVFISDMYLPVGFIQSVLQKYDFLTEADLLFISSDKAATKASGKLYQVVRQALNDNSGDWIHMGDNLHSDIAVPKDYKIKTKVIHHTLTDAEKFSSDMSDCSPLATVFSASISKSVRLGLPDTPENEFAADFVAPLFVPFVYWIFDNARKQGVSKLFFIARDGEILYEIAKVLQPIFPDISIEYLYMSRLSVYFPSASTFDEIVNLIDWDMIGDQKLSAVMQHYFGLDCKEHVSKEFLYANAEIHNKLINCRDEALQNTLLYFKQTGLASSSEEKKAIIDLRGTGKTYCAINKLLLANGYNPISAFYYEMQPDRIAYSKKASYQFMMGQEMYRGVFSCLNKGYSILESYFAAADHPRTLRYTISEDGNSIPVFEDCPGLSENSRIFNINKEASILWARAFISTKAYADYHHYIHYGILCLTNLLSFPQQKFLKLFSKISISETGMEHDYLVRNMPLKELIGISKAKSLSWYEGSYRYTVNKNFLYFDIVIRCIRKITRIEKHFSKFIKQLF